jgi:hypothetical protein
VSLPAAAYDKSGGARIKVAHHCASPKTQSRRECIMDASSQGDTMIYMCTHCKSDDIERLSAVYESGLATLRPKTTGLGPGGARTSASAQTAATRRAAPPPRKPYLKPLIGIALVFALFALIVGSAGPVLDTAYRLAWLAASAIWAFHAYHYNVTTWSALKAIWDRSFVCNRCHTMFAR